MYLCVLEINNVCTFERKVYCSIAKKLVVDSHHMNPNCTNNVCGGGRSGRRNVRRPEWVVVKRE